LARRLTTAAALALTALAATAPAASATFHLMQIREVYPGSVASPSAEYVELQMWAPDQNHVAGHVLRTYDASGAVTGSDSFLADVPRGADQSTMVLATPEAEAALGFIADASLAPSGRLDPSGGAVCWESIDCISWGDFTGSLPSPAGTPAAASGIPEGMALRRTIAPGCATLLEPGDDHDNSAADFAPVFPAPRPNSVVPAEHDCVGGTAAAGGGAGPAAPGGHNPAGTPRTRLLGRPPRRSRDRTPTFRFGADEAVNRFECRIDGAPFRRCVSPFTARRLSPGHHIFRVRARDDTEVADPSPVRFGFAVLPRG